MCLCGCACVLCQCTTDTCSAGTCGHSNIASGTACGSGDVCNGSGTCVDCMTASDCDDSLECTVDTCSSNTCANTNKAAGTSCAQGTCAGSVCDDGAAPSVSNVGLSQTTSTSMTATGSVDEASTIRCVLLSSTASVPAKSVVSVSASTSVMATSGSFSVTISNVAGTGSKTAYCMGIDAGGAQGDVISSASTSFGTWWWPCLAVDVCVWLVGCGWLAVAGCVCGLVCVCVYGCVGVCMAVCLCLC